MPKTLPTVVADPDVDPVPTSPALRELSLVQLVESPLNPRTHFDEAKLDELAETIRDHGVIEPLVVRRQENAPLNQISSYEIVAGARRYRAAHRAGLARVPCVVRDLTDVQVLEIMVIENGQRSDIDALDEARGYRMLLGFGEGQFSAASIAQKIGRTEKYVWDRLKLLDLIPEAQALLAAGRITAGHAILIARQTPENQIRIITVNDDGSYGSDKRALWRVEHSLALVDDDDPDRATGRHANLKAVTVRELEAWIATHIRADVAHLATVAPLDFGEAAAKVEEAQQRPGRGKKVVAITHDPSQTLCSQCAHGAEIAGVFLRVLCEGARLGGALSFEALPVARQTPFVMICRAVVEAIREDTVAALEADATAALDQVATIGSFVCDRFPGAAAAAQRHQLPLAVVVCELLERAADDQGIVIASSIGGRR